eukprot:TRINITY_DN19697_c0_g1_i5.p1 TRINITY_DN19697_c0_g1~~TRINITY_DN19697_c0_g1_i5.p1  ORF type:complete len:146 (-),score=37.47 TRINITY_DN19697_c0_g1_i5:5-442(-)
MIFFFSSRRRHTRCREVSWARRCVQETGKVEYTFYDANSNQAIQNQQINKALEEGTDLVLLNIVDRAYAQQVIDKIKQKNIPVILFNREPLTPVPIQSYGKSLYIGTNPCLLYTSDAADDTPCVDLCGRRFIQKKKKSQSQQCTY